MDKRLRIRLKAFVGFGSSLNKLLPRSEVPVVQAGEVFSVLIGVASHDMNNGLHGPTLFLQARELQRRSIDFRIFEQCWAHAIRAWAEPAQSVLTFLSEFAGIFHIRNINGVSKVIGYHRSCRSC